MNPLRSLRDYNARRAVARCQKVGHDWFPNLGGREFALTMDICLRCGQYRPILPHGTCLGGHPIADHFGVEGERYVERDVPGCPGPR